MQKQPAERKSLRRMDPGTVNLAEIMAFTQPLLYLASQMKPSRFCRVHVISDSQYVVNTGNSNAPQQPTDRCGG